MMIKSWALMTRGIVLIAGLSLAVIGLLVTEPARAQTQDAVRTKEKVISDQINHLRGLPDDVRARTAKQLAIDIRQLPPANKLNLARLRDGRYVLLKCTGTKLTGLVK